MTAIHRQGETQVPASRAVAGHTGPQATANPAVPALGDKSSGEETLQRKPVDKPVKAGKQDLKRKPMRQMKSKGGESFLQKKEAFSFVHRTGMPDQLKPGIEHLSGFSTDGINGIKGPYNSSPPALPNALAYAQGAGMHTGPGQGRQLSHASWQVVQQSKGRVRPALQAKGMAIGDDKGVERAADQLGAKALNLVQSSGQEKGGVPATAVSSPWRGHKPPHDRSGRVTRTVTQRKQNSRLAESVVYQRMVFPAGRVGLSANLDTANFAVAEQQLHQMADANLQAELRHVQRTLTENGVSSGWLEGKTNDEKLLKITNKLLADGPDVPEKEAMGYFEKRRASATVAGQPAVNPQLLAAINIWVVGNPQTGIVWSALGNHLRGKINIGGYRDFGLQCYLLLSPPQQLLFDNANPTEPGLTMAYVALARAEFAQAAQDLRNGLGGLPDFAGTSYRQAGLADATVFNGKVAANDLIMDKTFWSTSILRGAGGAAGNWDDIGSTAHPIVYFVIRGTTGKYIAKYAQTEGEQEVLFRDRVVFNVDRIVNLKNVTFFVYLTEVAPPPGGTVIKNPFTGDPY